MICLPRNDQKYDLPLQQDAVKVYIEVHIKDIPKVKLLWFTIVKQFIQSKRNYINVSSRPFNIYHESSYSYILNSLFGPLFECCQKQLKSWVPLISNLKNRSYSTYRLYLLWWSEMNVLGFWQRLLHNFGCILQCEMAGYKAHINSVQQCNRQEEIKIWRQVQHDCC